MPFFGGPPAAPPGTGLYHYVSTNILGGTGALNVSTGQNNIALGTGALQNILAGDTNIALGNTAGNAVISGNSNVFLTSDGSNGLLDTASDVITIGNSINPSAVSLSDVILIGQNITVPDGNQNSIVIGWTSVANDDEAIAIGHGTNCGNRSVAIGHNVSGNQQQGVAIGDFASIQGTFAIAIGKDSRAYENGIALGAGASNATFIDSIAIGTGVNNTATNQIKIGDTTYPDVSLGGYNVVRRLNSTAVDVVAPNDANLNTVYSFNIPAGTLGPNGVLEIWAVGNVGATFTAPITFAVYLGGVLIANAAGTGANRALIINLKSILSAANAQRNSYENIQATIGSNVAFNDTAVNTAVDKLLEIKVQKIIGGDTFTFKSLLCNFTHA